MRRGVAVAIAGTAVVDGARGVVRVKDDSRRGAHGCPADWCALANDTLRRSIAASRMAAIVASARVVVLRGGFGGHQNGH